ncbi:MAG: hypothetical protein SPF19_14400 [Oliverpabstia sp.]|nr:hypothetical protein [Lachnospiraceae bacterium]MDY5027685.1 hypothetical protein [Oliverpabstia sp.]
MLKIRLQGTIGDIQWFRKILDQTPEIEITEFSRSYTNKGTNRYYRVYAEAIKINKTEKDEKQWERL